MNSQSKASVLSFLFIFCGGYNICPLAYYIGVIYMLQVARHEQICRIHLLLSGLLRSL